MVKLIIQTYGAEALCEVRPHSAETAATLLRTFLDRAPSGDREAIARIADTISEVATQAIAAENEAL